MHQPMSLPIPLLKIFWPSPLRILLGRCRRCAGGTLSSPVGSMTCPCRCSGSNEHRIDRKWSSSCLHRRSFASRCRDDRWLDRSGSSAGCCAESGQRSPSSAWSWPSALGSKLPALGPSSLASWMWPRTSAPSASPCRQSPSGPEGGSASWRAMLEHSLMSACGGFLTGAQAVWSFTTLSAVVSSEGGIQTSAI